MNFQMFKLDLEKAEEPEIKLPTSVGWSENQENARKTSTSALLITPKPLGGSQQSVDIPLTYLNLFRGHVELSYVRQSNLTRVY